MMFKGLQALRGISVMLVVIQHSVYFGALTVGSAWNNYLPTNIGLFGVYLFFCISGAAICIASETTAGDFEINRLARIYPPYFVAIIIAFTVATLAQMGTHYPTLFATSIFLIPSGSASFAYGVPYWSLVYEVFFYTVVAVLLLLNLSSLQRSIIMTLWATIVIATTNGSDELLLLFPSAAQIFLSPMCAIFCAGYVLMFSIKRGWIHLGAFVTCAVVSAAFNHSHSLSLVVYLAITLAALSASMMLKDANRYLVQVGNYSYGVYLIHMPIIVALHVLGVGSTLGMAATFILYFLISFVAGLLFGAAEYRFHRQFMKPLLSRALSNSPSAQAERG